MKTQILFIHGGMTFKRDKDYLKYLKAKSVSKEKVSYWTGEYFEKSMGKNYEIIIPQMPLHYNAKYRDWKIFFEKYLVLLGKRYVLIGQSLGGVFLAKYLSEHKLKKQAISVFLICPPFDNSLPGEDLVGGFKLKSNLSLIEKNCKNLYLMFSKDDDVVPLQHAEKYKKKLPLAKTIIYNNKNGHFQIKKFPEIVKIIKNDTKI